MKILKNTTLIVAGICTLYIIGIFALWDSELSYRMWVDAAGKILTVLVLPLLVILLAGKCFYQVVDVKDIIKIFLGLALIVVYAFWVVAAGFVLSGTIHKEAKLTDHLLVVNEAEFLEESHYAYYRPVSFLFKEPGELTNEVKAEYLEGKYGRTFGVSGRGSSTENGRVFDEEYPEVEVDVYRSAMELEDNYVEKLSQKYLEEGYEALDITREYYVSEKSGYSGWIYMELLGEADIEAFAKDAALLLQYVMDKTDFFKEYRGILGFYNGEGEDKITGFLPFGKVNIGDEVQEDYYLDQEQVTGLVREKYEKALDERKSWQEYLQKHLEQGNAVESSDHDTDSIDDNQTKETTEAISSPEEGARTIYDTVLAEQGYSYEVNYNAKGNLYIDLGSRSAGEPEDKSCTGSYRFTLVYDRTSKNGNCELFVLYKEHYTESSANGGSTNDATAILDMYAVEKTSGSVIASGKHGWADVGAAEYREITGE